MVPESVEMWSTSTRARKDSETTKTRPEWRCPGSFLLHLEGPSAQVPQTSGSGPRKAAVVAPSWAHSALWCLEARASAPRFLGRALCDPREISALWGSPLFLRSLVPGRKEGQESLRFVLKRGLM